MCKLYGARLAFAHFLLSVQKAGFRLSLQTCPTQTGLTVGTMAIVAQAARKISQRTETALAAACSGSG
jgi:hypothetical protein